MKIRGKFCFCAEKEISSGTGERPRTVEGLDGGMGERQRIIKGPPACRSRGGICMEAGIFFLGGSPAAEMALAQIDAEDVFDALGEVGIERRQSFGDVFVHGGFARCEGLGTCAHGGARLDDVFPAFSDPFLDAFPHIPSRLRQDTLSYVESRGIILFFSGSLPARRVNAYLFSLECLFKDPYDFYHETSSLPPMSAV